MATSNQEQMEKLSKQYFDRILSEQKLPWNCPWDRFGIPQQNGVSGYKYRGINILFTSFSPYSSPYWFTKKNFVGLGGRVPYEDFKNFTPIVLWKRQKAAKKNDNDEDRYYWLLRYYQVWNLQQINFPEEVAKRFEIVPTVKTEKERIEAAESIYTGYKNPPTFQFIESDMAYYRPSNDSITLPLFEQFHSIEGYYSTLFHEMGHSTGHSSRLNRGLDKDTIINHEHRYAFEELVAEMTAAFLCSFAGLAKEPLDNSVAYLQTWHSRLSKDPSLLFSAASLAQKAAEHIMNIEPPKYEEEDAD